VSFGDVLIVAHEIGHNFGSPHTHCYSPPIDTCYNGEAANGCFAGTPSCPAPATVNGLPNVTGTLMSYCHLLGGCSSSLVFHPRTVSLLTPKIQAAACIASALSVTGVAPQSGATTGGTAVTITGGGFVSGATVSFGGAAATSVVVVNATTITAHVPAHATGPVTVTVTNPDTASAPLANSFFYAPPPAVTDFYTLPPRRVVDTRLANGPLGGPQLGASAQRVFPVAGSCGIPAAAKAIAANVTAYNPAAAGTFSLYPGNAFPLGTYALGFTAGANRADGSVLPLATDGSGSLGVQNASGGATHLILDVFGYFQ